MEFILAQAGSATPVTVWGNSARGGESEGDAAHVVAGGSDTMKGIRDKAVWVAPAFVLALAGCSGDGPGIGKLSLAVTDAPVDGATAVVVQFTGVEIKPANAASRTFDFAIPRQIDLLALSGTDSETLLDEVEVRAGRYEWVRLKVAAEEDGIFDSYINLSDGSQHELAVPSGAETGLKLHSGFSVPNGGAASFTMDFDLRKSVHEPMNASESYVLRPTLRIVDNARIGAIAGTVDNTWIVTGCTPAVYVFSGSFVTPDDVDGVAPEPVTSAIVELNSGSGHYEYTAGFLGEGAYTVSFTCFAAADDPAANDTLTFAGTQNAMVIADQTTTVNFGP